MNKKEEAVHLFNKGYNCCQSVVCVFSKELSIDKETAFNISGGFVGGALNGELCGVISGAIMVIGLKNNNSTLEEEVQKRIQKQTKDFTDRFRKIHGDLVCKGLLGYDLSKPDDYKVLVEKELFKTKCPTYIETAVELLESIFS